MVKLSSQKHWKFSTNNSRYLFTLDNNAKEWQIDIFDAEIEESTEKILSKNYEATYNISLVQYKDEFIFHTPDNCLWIIDAKTFCVRRRYLEKSLCPGPLNFYWKGSLYAFGGWWTPNNDFAYKYDLAKDVWSKMCKFPKKISWCACIFYKNAVLISSFSISEIFQYDISIDSYSVIFEFQGGESKDKIIFAQNSRAYLVINGGIIFESGLKDEYSWSQLTCPRFSLSGANIPWITYKNSVIIATYMSMKNKIYYSFDLSAKKVKKIQKKQKSVCCDLF